MQDSSIFRTFSKEYGKSRGHKTTAFRLSNNNVIPSQCAHWRGNPQPKKEIATPACGLVRNDI